MATSYPRDRFDEIPENLQRVGAHRAPRKKHAGLIRFAWALLAVAAIVAIGVAALFLATGRIDPGKLFAPGTTQTTQPSKTPTQAAPTVDPSLDVTVLNGTPTDGLATTVGDLLTAKGWTVTARLDADDRQIAETRVYYLDPADEGAARGLAEALGNAQIALSSESTELGTPLIVVVGTDYTSGS